MPQSSPSPFVTPIALDRDTFMRQFIANLGHLHEGIRGSAVTSVYITNVGLSMGAAIEAEYKRFWQIDRPFTLDEYAHVIIDLKQKIQGNFSLVSKDPTKVVVRTTSCPFDAFVRQSPSLCFMTSSVFGGIAARNFGYAKVVLQQRIALGDAGCYIIVYLQRTPEAEAAVGKEYNPETHLATPDIAGQLAHMQTTLQREDAWRDVTEHREMERLKDELLTSTSHELRTPVTTIKGMTQLLLRAIDDGQPIDPAKLAQRLQLIQREADRLARLGQKLDDVARLQSDGMTLHATRHDLSALVADVLARQRERKGTVIAHTFTLATPDAPVWVMVAPERIAQALESLLENAVKFTPEGGDIPLQVMQENAHAVVRIRDSGIGIHAGDLDKVFTPFFRGSNISARNYAGLGLGLYLCQAIVQAHEGSLSVASTEGEGTTVTLTLPLQEAEMEVGI